MLNNKKTGYIITGIEVISNNEKDNKLSLKDLLFKKRKKFSEEIIKSNIAYYNNIKKELSKFVDHPIIIFSFNNNEEFLNELKSINVDEWIVFPLFPHFSYELTGKIADFFSKNISEDILQKIKWIKSYGSHPSFIKSWKENILNSLKSNILKEEETSFIFVTKNIKKNDQDIFFYESINSCRKILKNFPYALGNIISSINDISLEMINKFNRKNILLIPISDIINDLSTEEYYNFLKKNYVNTYVCEPLKFQNFWINSIIDIFKDHEIVNNQMLLNKQLI